MHPYLPPPEIYEDTDEIGAFDAAGDGAAPEAEVVFVPRERTPQEQTRQQAIIWAVVVHVIIVVICVFIVAVPREDDAPEIIAEVMVPDRSQNLKMQKLSAVKQLKTVRASASAPMSKVIRANTSAVIAAPEVKVETSSPLGLGMGDLGSGFGLGNGVGGGGGMGMARIPATMRGRCIPGERTRLLFENGGTAEVEKAVIKALDWLKEEQNEDGSWGPDYQGAMTGFALLCYLGHCETPKSEKYGDTVAKGLQFLVEMAKRQGGKIGDLNNRHWSYEHGIAAYALGEANALLKLEGSAIPGLTEAFEQSVAIIVEGQNEDGGWVYAYEGIGSGDLSVTGWQFQALKTASYSRSNIDGLSNAMSKAMRFIAGRQGEKGGFGYRGVGDRHSLTGVGILGLQFLTRGKRSQIARGFEFYLSRAPFEYDTTSADLYSWYYMNQAAFNYGGQVWEEWNGMVLDQLLEAQRRDGSFRPEGSNKSSQARGSRDIYRTCLITLMLEVYYRYLPATG